MVARWQNMSTASSVKRQGLTHNGVMGWGGLGIIN